MNRLVEQAELIAGHTDSRDFIYRDTCAMGVHVIVNEPVDTVEGRLTYERRVALI